MSRTQETGLGLPTVVASLAPSPALAGTSTPPGAEGGQNWGAQSQPHASRHGDSALQCAFSPRHQAREHSPGTVAYSVLLAFVPVLFSENTCSVNQGTTPVSGPVSAEPKDTAHSLCGLRPGA